jgi:hypothetical protein
MKKSLNIFLLVCLSLLAHAKKQVNNLRVELTKSYTVGEAALLEMNIDFANVTIETAAVNEIKFVMTASGLKDDEKCIQEVQEQFEMATRATANGASITLDGVFEKCKVRQSCNVKVTVQIIIPTKTRVYGTSSFGNVTMKTLVDEARLRCDYGNVVCEGLWSYSNDIVVEFGNLEVWGSNGGKFNVQYGNFALGKLQGSAKISAEFGNIQLSQVTKECPYLDIRAGYGNVELSLDTECSFGLDVKSYYGRVDLDDAIKIARSEKDYTEEIRKGTIGSGSGTLKVEAEFGNVEIDVR